MVDDTTKRGTLSPVIEGLERAIKLAGGQSALARRIGVNQRHVWNWLHRQRRVPAERVLDIERALGAEVTRHDLRPDLYPETHQA